LRGGMNVSLGAVFANFGILAALLAAKMVPKMYCLNAGTIDRTQFSLLVTVVVLPAIVPTAIAQHWFSPSVEAEHAAHDQPAPSVVPSPARPLPAGERA
jgi:hypothetical protein